MNISKDKISIKTLTEEDMLFVQKLWGDDDTMFTSGGKYIIKDEDINTMFTILHQGEEINNHYIIFNDEKAIGDLSIRDFDEDKKAQLDFKLFNDQRKKGYGKQTLDLILDYFFNTAKGEEIFIEVWLVNSFVNAKLKDYGFKETEVMEDATIMTLTRENYNGGTYNV